MQPAMTLPRVTLAPGLDVPRIVTGLWQVADQERSGTPLDTDTAAEALEGYAAAGFDAFDMADHYGSAELIAGRMLARGRFPSARAFTKWVPTPGPMTSAVVKAGIDERRARLGVETIDLMQFHWWHFRYPGYIDAFRELTALKAQGAVRHLGVTNFDTDHLRVLVKHGLRLRRTRCRSPCSTGARPARCPPSAWPRASRSSPTARLAAGS
jgi:aryl-alcohol dehydrogenase-like predicted oxidoreductase